MKYHYFLEANLSTGASTADTVLRKPTRGCKANTFKRVALFTEGPGTYLQTSLASGSRQRADALEVLVRDEMSDGVGGKALFGATAVVDSNGPGAPMIHGVNDDIVLS